jgi:hypothetical protein
MKVRVPVFWWKLSHLNRQGRWTKTSGHTVRLQDITPHSWLYFTVWITLEECAQRLQTQCLPEMVLCRILNSAAVEQPEVCFQFVVCSNIRGQHTTINTNFSWEIHWKVVTQWMVVEQYRVGWCNGNARYPCSVAAWFKSQAGHWTILT